MSMALFIYLFIISLLFIQVINLISKRDLTIFEATQKKKKYCSKVQGLHEGELLSRLGR